MMMVVAAANHSHRLENGFQPFTEFVAVDGSFKSFYQKSHPLNLRLVASSKASTLRLQ